MALLPFMAAYCGGGFDPADLESNRQLRYSGHILKTRAGSNAPGVYSYWELFR
jgi:hypothetical protein